MMVSEATTTRNQTLSPSDKHITAIRPKSRYLSPSPSISSNSNSLRTVTPSRRSPSPLISRNSTTPAVKRSLSVDRRPPDGGAGATSTRSVSVSFQGASFSLPITKTKITHHQSPAFIRNGDHVENAKPMDHHRWPGRTRQPNATVLSKTSTLDCSNGVIRESVYVLNPYKHNPDGNSVKDSYSDTDSVSSGSTSGVQENGPTRLRVGHSGITVSPKFWQDTNSRTRRLQDQSSPLSKNLNSKRFSSDNNPLSSARTTASPNRIRPSSPNKIVMTPSPKRMISPRRRSVSGIDNNVSEMPSVLSFAVDVRRGKVSQNLFLDAHVLRLLYNRLLQWRFVNARNEDIVLKQKLGVEENLWNAWITISGLRDSVTRKRHRLQLLRQKLKLASLLKAQMGFLEDWGYLDKNHSISWLGAIEALKASTLRLPVAAGATVDLQSMKDAINSALDVMQAMGSSSLMNSLCLQVEEVNLLVTKIVKVSGKEGALLRVCKDFLSVLSALKVKDCSLRTHMLQTSRCC
ncbi:QWRF motif-containing protein 2-like [Bidens hawaiensis]|uniref:QWRF motif-containing protein 2-like n=1 Tax=Bidens hawaiensis TaxID=980011 RepID=UPI00404B4398